VAIRGVNAPSHFLVRDESDGAYLDPFAGAVEVPDVDAPTVDTKVILSRMLNNLRSIYTASGDIANLFWVLGLRTRMPGASPDAHYELLRTRARLN
jgi:hypothetical protein